MARAAVPAYLESGLCHAAPGHYFELYFPVWKLEPGHVADKEIVDKKAKGKAVDNTLRLTENDKNALAALARRQRAICNDAMLQLPVRTVAPLTTGLGLEHPLENGFAFLKPYGLPYLAGSGVKGVLRAAALELIEDDESVAGWTRDHVDILFGYADEERAQSGALVFWDVFPEQLEALAAEIMTPHHSAYFQGKEPPHDSESPNPIYFLAIPPNTPMLFHIACRRAPKLAGSDTPVAWQALIQEAFEYACEWLGFGAKTAVGYGHLKIDSRRQQEWQDERAEREAAQQARAALDEAVAGQPDDAADFIRRREQTAQWDNNGEFLAEAEAWLIEATGDTLSQAAWDLVRADIESRKTYKGIFANPNAVNKKQKPQYKDRPRKLVMALIEKAPKNNPS